VRVRARRQAWRVALLGAIVGFVVVPTRAEASPPPTARHRKYRPYVDRSANLPRPYAYGTLGLGTNVHIGLPPQDELNIGFGVGLTPRVWLDGALGTLRVAPSLVFHSAQLGPNLLIVDTPAFELDATMHLSAPADDGRPIEQIEPGIFTVAHAGHALRVDTGLFLDINPGPTSTVGFRLPAAFAFQLGEKFYASVNTGVGTGSFADAGQTTAIPAGLTLGWTDYLGPKGAEVIGFMPSINFPELLKPWADEAFRPGLFSVSITFIYLWKY
jgi:hypothetical protein